MNWVTDNPGTLGVRNTRKTGGTLVLRCQEGGGEGFFEGEDFVEVIEGVGVLSSEDAVFDKEEDDLTDVTAFRDTPVMKEGRRHGTVFLDEVVPKAEE